MKQRKTTCSVSPGSVVGTVHDEGSLKAALRVRPGKVDLLELRVDAFADAPKALDALERLAAKTALPLVVTVRHPSEGGANALSAARRTALFERFLPLAAWVDVELRSVPALEAVLKAARAKNTGVILSHHDFRTTPSLTRLQTLAARAARAGADVFKVATTAASPAALSTLLRLLTEKPRLPMAVMGMGAYGKISRLTLGQAGSVLNYGYLHRVQVPGQWPAPLLKERLAELGSNRPGK